MPYEVTRRFERALCEYTGAPYAVAVNSCTAAITLAVSWFLSDCRRYDPLYRKLPESFWQRWHSFEQAIEIPRRTYVSVPMSIIQAGGRLVWRDEAWRGAYQLKPLPVWDCARRFTSGMYVAGQFQCVSFSASKILAAEQGGAILHDNPHADAWFRRMRFDGRTEGADPMTDNIREIGHHCIMLPSVAATLLLRLHHLPRHNEDLPEREYPDLSQWDAFR